MVHVEFVDLSEFGIRFPNDRVRMVLAQPHLPREDFTTDEPFRFPSGSGTTAREHSPTDAHSGD